MDRVQRLPATVISRAERLVLLAVANYARPDGTGARPSTATMAHRAGFSRRHTRRLLDGLVDRGLLQVERPHPLSTGRQPTG